LRRVSTITSAPSAPWTRSCHMKPKRSWPGVPNRYSLTSSSIVMQPKSRATVVVVLPGTWPVRSTEAATEVIAASVVSGLISEMDDTAVVLPTPKPPAMTILTGAGGRAAGSVNGFESTNDPFDHAEVVRVARRPPDDDVALLGEVGHQHPGDADVQAEHGGHLGDRHGAPAEGDDLLPFERELRVRRRAEAGRHDLRLDLEALVDRLGALRRHQVGPQQRRFFGHHDPTVFLSSSIRPGVRTSVARLANIAIS